MQVWAFSAPAKEERDGISLAMHVVLLSALVQGWLYCFSNKEVFLTREKLLDIGAQGLRLFQELLQWLFLGVGCQKGVSTGNFLLQVYK